MTRPRRPLLGLLASAPLLLGALACQPRGELVAADGGRRQSAVDPTSKVSVVLTTGAWEGDPYYLDEDLTVIHAVIANMGDRPVRLAPGDLDLIDERGFRHELLDAGGTFALEGKATHTYAIGRSNDFSSISPFGDIAPSALPWGVLLPGTTMRGYLYFKRVDNHANAARLTWHFFEPSGVPVVDIHFDFYIADTDE
ncbi:MAG: hypothetical protein H6711_07255 [Myxococcales bacterium]|nr:hypothetical protein [Myxococcales bacterium]